MVLMFGGSSQKENETWGGKERGRKRNSEVWSTAGRHEQKWWNAMAMSNNQKEKVENPKY